MKRVQQCQVEAGGFGGGAQVLVGILGAREEQAAEGGARFWLRGAAAQLGFQCRAFVRGGSEEALHELGVGELAQSVPAKSLCEVGRKAASCSTASIQERMSGSCSPSQPR